jgi:hypothetical protein
VKPSRLCIVLICLRSGLVVRRLVALREAVSVWLCVQLSEELFEDSVVDLELTRSHLSTELLSVKPGIDHLPELLDRPGSEGLGLVGESFRFEHLLELDTK